MDRYVTLHSVPPWAGRSPNLTNRTQSAVQLVQELQLDAGWLLYACWHGREEVLLRGSRAGRGESDNYVCVWLGF